MKFKLFLPLLVQLLLAAGEERSAYFQKNYGLQRHLALKYRALIIKYATACLSDEHCISMNIKIGALNGRLKCKFDITCLRSTHDSCYIKEIVLTGNRKYESTVDKQTENQMTIKSFGMTGSSDRSPYSIYSSKRNTDVRTRLLVMAASFGESPDYFRQLNLHKNTISYYRNLKLSSMTAVFYSTVLERLMVATSQEIVTFPIDSNKGVILKQDIRCLDIIEDRKSKLIFLAVPSATYDIRKITVTKSNFKTKISVVKTQLIALDPNHKIIFICRKQTLLSVNYAGKIKNILDKNNVKKMSALTFDENRNVLYFAKDTALFKRTNDHSEQIMSFNYRPWNLVCYGQNIYVSYKSLNDNIDIITPNLTVISVKNDFPGMTARVMISAAP